METDINKQVLDKIQFGDHLISSTKQFKNLEGIQKLQRKINQELNFLKKIYKTNTIKKEHLQCSNLTHFSALISTLVNIKNCTSVSKVFMFNDRKITVDIVSEGGLVWTKVVARNPKSLNQICLGDTSFGVRSVLDQAEDFLECAKLHPCLFQIPKITFVFANGITSDLVVKLETLGITVEGNRLNETHCTDTETVQNESEINNLSTENVSTINRVNLDVSAMLAFVSSVTNGSAGLYDFSVKVLAQQAECERLRPLKPVLDQFFKDKQLFCCQTAKDNFVNIVQTVGGPNEQIRAEELLKRLTVLPDDATIDTIDNNEIFKNVQFTEDKILNIGGKIKQRSLVIFTFGDRIKAVTVTANDGFVRAAKQQGINFVVFVHESRALTEQKEQTRGVKF